MMENKVRDKTASTAKGAIVLCKRSPLIKNTFALIPAAAFHLSCKSNAVKFLSSICNSVDFYRFGRLVTTFVFEQIGSVNF